MRVCQFQSNKKAANMKSLLIVSKPVLVQTTETLISVTNTDVADTDGKEVQIINEHIS